MDNSDKPKNDHSFTNGMAAALFLTAAVVGGALAKPHVERSVGEFCHEFTREIARFNRFDLR